MALEMVVDNPAAAVPATQPQAGELTVGELKKRLAIITDAMREVMVEGVDYGIIPGTKKPSLYKPGAEKLCVLFQFGGKPSRITKTYDGSHLTVDVEYDLFHIPTGRLIGTGVGSASTKESKYAYRKAERICPKCDQPAIRKSGFPDRETGDVGWYCNQKAGGCNAKFFSADPAIIDQEATGRSDNPDLADQWNTILKMGKKRAKIDATLDATGASATFTQDLEDQRRRPTTTVSRPREEDTKPSDVASPEKRVQVWEAAKKRLAEGATQWWLDEQTMRKVKTDAKTKQPLFTYGDCSEMLKKLIAMGQLPEDSQAPPPNQDEGPDPADSFTLESEDL